MTRCLRAYAAALLRAFADERVEHALTRETRTALDIADYACHASPSPIAFAATRRASHNRVYVAVRRWQRRSKQKRAVGNKIRFLCLLPSPASHFDTAHTFFLHAFFHVISAARRHAATARLPPKMPRHDDSACHVDAAIDDADTTVGYATPPLCRALRHDISTMPTLMPRYAPCAISPRHDTVRFFAIDYAAAFFSPFDAAAATPPCHTAKDMPPLLLITATLSYFATPLFSLITPPLRLTPFRFFATRHHARARC